MTYCSISAGYTQRTTVKICENIAKFWNAERSIDNKTKVNIFIYEMYWLVVSLCFTFWKITEQSKMCEICNKK